MKKLAVLLLIMSGMLFAEGKKLTFDQLMGKGEKLLQRMPYIPGWADKNHYFEYRKGALVKVNVRTGKTSPYMSAAIVEGMKKKGLHPMYARDKMKDLSRFVFVQKGDVVAYIKDGDKVIKVTETKEAEKNPKFSPDGKKIAFTRNNDLYVYDIPSAKETRVTTDGSEVILNGYASWVYYEEIIGRRSRYRAFWWSPDSNKVVFIRFDQSKVPVYSLFRDEIGVYGKYEKLRYPKPGFPNPTVKLGIYTLGGKDVQWIKYKDEKDHYLCFPVWNSKSNKIFFQWMNRPQNHIKIHTFDPATEKLATVYEEKQPAWVDFLSGSHFNLLKNDDLLIVSSKTGWKHLYYISKGKVRAITKGNWNVSSVNLIDKKKRQIFFTAGVENSMESQLYKVSFKGGKLRKLTKRKGSHRSVVSPDGRYFIDTWSDIHNPGYKWLKRGNGKIVRTLGEAAGKNYKDYKLAKVESFRVKTDDGFELPVTWYLPPDFDKNKKYPVLMSIYGGPDAAIVGNRFGAGYARGMTKFFLAQEGIINVFVDNRGSGHFGKKGMDMIYRNLGKWEISDYTTVVKFLRTKSFIDAEKIGITGHSYGGYVAAMALVTAPDYFQFGSSNSPVTDWALYDSVYTERYMGTPQNNPEGYKYGSAMTHIKKFKGKIRLTHGTADDNVHPQNAMQFLDKLLDEGHTADFMLYPACRHGIGGKKRLENYREELNFWFRNFLHRTVK